MPSGDVDTSRIDFYEFLSLPGPQATESEIKRAGRKTSLLYHPDKVAPTPENLQNFHILQIAIGVLSDPAEKAKYDQTREAKLRRKAENDALDARRRKMREDLENRETNGNDDVPSVLGQKRTFSEREMKIRRIQEENRRKIEEMKARKRAEAEQASVVERAKSTKEMPEGKHNSETNGIAARTGEENASMDRSVKLRWLREGEGQGYDEGVIGDMFGDVENVVLLKDKKRKVDGKNFIMGTAVVVFTSITAANAIMDGKSKLYDKFDSVEWAKTKEQKFD